MENTAIENLSFEQAVGELEKIVSILEQGTCDLEESIQNYERGIALKKHCAAKLQDAEAKIEKISFGQDGAVKTEALDLNAG